MKLKKAFKLASRNISRNKLRNSLVILAFILAVILGGIIIGPVYGLRDYFKNSINEAGFNAMVITNGGQSIEGYTSPPVKFIKLKEIKELKESKIEGLIALSPVIFVGIFNFGKNFSILVGVWEDIKIVGQFNIKEGRFLTDNDANDSKINAVLGYNVWKEFLGGKVNVESYLSLTLIIPTSQVNYTIKDVNLYVIGLLSKRPQIPGTNIDPNNVIYIPLNKALDLLNVKEYDEAIIQTTFASSDTFENLDKVSNRILDFFTSKGFVKGRDITIITQKDALAYVDRVFVQFNNFISIIWIVVLVISSLSILIVMVISVKERFKEIGTLRALGAKRNDILQIFIYEALLLSSIGIIIGLFLSFFTIELLKGYFDFVRTITSNVLFNTYLILIPQIILAALLFSLYPAYKASKIEPAVALKYE